MLLEVRQKSKNIPTIPPLQGNSVQTLTTVRGLTLFSPRVLTGVLHPQIIGRAVGNTIATARQYMPKRSLTQWGARDPGASLTTGQDLKKKDPERYAAIVTALKEGIGHDSLTRVFNTTHATLKAIASVEQVEASSQDQILQRLTKTRDLCVSKYHEALEAGEIKPSNLPVHAAIIIDKMHQISGQPSTIVEHRSISLTPKALNDLKDQCKPTQIIEAEVVNEQRTK